MFNDIFVTAKHTSSTRVKHTYVSTSINDILEPHSFEDQWNVLKSIMQHISLYEHFEFLGDSTPKLCRFNIRYLNNMAKL